jgi:hypothetical protein
MKHETMAAAPPTCRYGASRLLFRGPRRPTDGCHIAVVGGAQTLGREVEAPYPALLEEATGFPCANFGQANASVEAFLRDPFVPGACASARLTVVEITGAANLSNRFYTVHARRNDRFLQASTILRAIYPEVDFAELCFTGHLLRTLHAAAPGRFALLRAELQTAWSARMRGFLELIGPRTLLLWLSPQLPSDAPWEEREDPLLREPLFVTRRMLDGLRPLVRGVVMVRPRPEATPRQIHAETSRALAEAVRALLGL